MFTASAPASAQMNYSWPWLGVLGAASGTMGGLFGVGGAVVATPVLTGLFGTTQVVAQGLSLALAQEIATSADDKLKAVTWQATPGLFAYRRSIAKDVLGTDDPDAVQEALADWDKFNAVAEQAAAKGLCCEKSGLEEHSCER